MQAEPFADLPDALVKELLDIATPVADDVGTYIGALAAAKVDLRRSAHSAIRRKADLDRPREPSVVGVDGSYQMHTLTSVDLCAAAAVAVEGSSRQAARHWPEPYHRMWAGGVPHAVDATGVLRALMVLMELDLAHEAPHDLVLLDGSLASLIIYLNQGLVSAGDIPESLRRPLLDRWRAGGVAKLVGLLRSDRTAAVPKFTSRNEILGLPDVAAVVPRVGADGRTLATMILEPGEYLTPLPAYRRDDGEYEPYHLPRAYRTDAEDLMFNVALADVQVVYFRPYGWVPALRIEVPAAVANSPTRLSMTLEGLESQFFSPAVTEPYPLFMADRMVKSLGAGVHVVEQTISQHVVDGRIDVQTAMLCLQNYRTQGGRGGTA